MKQLKLADESIIEVTDDSTISNLTVPFSKYSDLDTLTALLTKENFERVELDDTVYVLVTVLGYEVNTVNKTLTVTTRNQSFDEAVIAQLHEMQDAIIEILEMIGGNE